MKALLSGNEAIARGAYEYGVKVASAYPGTPSSEILKNTAEYKDVIYVEWATNEKVATEVAIGASFGGSRTMTTMKSAGANVACDPLVAFTHAGVNGGFVMVICGDPGMASSSTEQDDRYFAKLARCPILEPSDSQEAKEFVGLALDLSEKFDIPVILRSTTGLSHSKSLVELGERTEHECKGFERNIAKNCLLPAYARKLRTWLIERERLLTEWGNESDINRIEPGDKKIGIISSGVTYQAAKEVMPNASFLKLGMTFPLPMEKIKKFAASVEKLFVVEELEPFIEEHIKAAGIPVIGKEVLPMEGEFTPDRIAAGFIKAGIDLPRWKDMANIVANPPKSVPRMPVQCAGCPHRGISMAIKKLDLNVCGDIGCYDLITLPPFEIMHTDLEMGGSVSNAVGVVRAGKQDKPTVAVIGDSTFFHSGMTGLLNAAYNKSNLTLLIFNNSITGMTGGQFNPGTEYTLSGVPADPVSIPEICKALGVKDVHVVDPYDYKACLDVLKETTAHEGVSVVMTNRPCMLYPKKYVAPQKCEVVADKCIGCHICLKQCTCPAFELTEQTTDKGKLIPRINPDDCVGCTICAQICPKDAIREVK
ncbi:MAG: indolepyruvate ferredoxin oxidoreductase subunit alpha [Firmicutes bacterium]|nr:indolepyruvate ferredoxin oxidoreductase subunit alpha [Bacillota bacterium]